MNQTIITGNLTADIETREVGEQHLCTFTAACNEGDRVVFMPVEAWNMPHLPEHLFKGSKVLLSGALKQDQWETEGGEKRSRILLTAYRVEFLDPAPEAPAGRQQSRADRSGGQGRGAPRQGRSAGSKGGGAKKRYAA